MLKKISIAIFWLAFFSFFFVQTDSEIHVPHQ